MCYSKENFETKNIPTTSFLFADVVALLSILALKLSFPEKV